MDGFFYSLLNTLCGGMVGFLKFYIVLLTIRVYLTWFPNINFYMQPFSSIGKMTDPYLRLFRGIIPPLIGFDLSPLLAFIFLTFLIDIFDSVVFT
jgi:YggT family protein|tara:strand:+ start:116 stop:400 length:285 start_codon:yes stop_codon:yes gene_type:complete